MRTNYDREQKIQSSLEDEGKALFEALIQGKMQPIIKQPARKELVSKGLTFNEPARKELVSKELTLKELAFSELTLNLPEDSVEKVQNLITLGMENQLNIELAEYRIQLASQLYPKLSTYDMYLYRCAFPNTITSIHKYDNDNEPIPHFIIANVVMSKKLNLFETIQIWKPDEKIKNDPIMVGIIGPHAFSLGIWGNPRIDIHAVERQMLESFYSIKDRIRRVVDKLPVTSALNTFKVILMEFANFDDVHCISKHENITKFLIFRERDDNMVKFNQTKLALCPQCGKIVNCSPTVME